MEFENITIINGNNFDKQDYVNVNKAISHDSDIKRLIRSGRWPLSFFIVLASIAIGLYLACPDFMEIYNEWENIGHFFATFSFEELKILLPKLAIPIFGIIFWGKETGVLLRKLPAYFKYMLSSSSPRNPTDIWASFNGSISDSQIILPAEKFYKDKMTLKYAGQPYYTSKAIDSITIEFYRPLFWFFKDWLLYNNYFREYAFTTFTSKADKNIFNKDRRTLNVSNNVFGIHFLSKYFKKLVEKKHEGLAPDKKLNIRCKNDSYMKYMCELCTHPNYINIVDENEKKYDISINEINYIKLDSSIRLVQFFKRTYRRINDFFYCRIRIPIKRYVALPNDDTADNLIICPGGAEQNLALLHYVNKHRWHPDSSMKIGISENHFDDYHNTNFQIGTEGFVYGITNNMKGRELRNNRNRAEIMSFDIGDTKIVSIYGYSAPMTKIASLKFIDCLANDNYKYIPWKRTTINNHLQYVVNYTGRSFFSSKEIEYWDNEDMLNYKSIDLECIKEKFTNINLEAYDYE